MSKFKDGNVVKRSISSDGLKVVVGDPWFVAKDTNGKLGFYNINDYEIAYDTVDRNELKKLKKKLDKALSEVKVLLSAKDT